MILWVKRVRELYIWFLHVQDYHQILETKLLVYIWDGSDFEYYEIPGTSSQCHRSHHVGTNIANGTGFVHTEIKNPIMV